MKKCGLWAVTLIATVVAGPVVLEGQQPVPPSGGINIALLDLSQVFKNHPGFNQKLDLIKKQIKDTEAQFNDQRKLINDKRAALAQYKVGSPEYERLEKEIANQAASLQLDVERKRRELLEQEGRVYYETYQEVRAIVESFCRAHNIALVLYYDSEPIDPTDRASIVRGINRFVIYQDRIDITGEVIRMVSAPRAAVRTR
ncbi:MAG: hypothetical protein KatS3mg110_3084 [Pirellulaceae bacterium]|nr:MAG: hypothetical protein KatS3mg110_3084 [Pirellulaceae bacterium]